MNHAEKCPVCEGRGKLEPSGTSSDGTLRICHGCKNGCGWVEVGGEVAVPPIDSTMWITWPPCYRPYETYPTVMPGIVYEDPFRYPTNSTGSAASSTVTDANVPYTFTGASTWGGAFLPSDRTEG